MLCPCQDAVVTRNGEVLTKESQLSPGDVIGLGQFYLFLFKDPLALMYKVQHPSSVFAVVCLLNFVKFLLSFLEMKEANSVAPESSLSTVPWMLGHTSTTSHTTNMILCNTCISACTDLQRLSCKQPLNTDPPFLKSPEGHSLTLNYKTEDEDRIVKEIVAMGNTGGKDRPPLTTAFLLCMCVQYSSTCLQTSDLRRLLLLIAGGVQSAMWVSCGKRNVATLIKNVALTMNQLTVLCSAQFLVGVGIIN